MRISHIAPFAVSAALSRACGRGRRVSARSARRFGCSNDAAGHRTAISRSGEAFGDLSGAVDAYGYNLRSEVVSARRTKGGASVRGFDEDFSYDPIGNRIATTNYTETGSAIVSEYSANNLNQYTSRTVPGVAAVRGFADANATVTVNENPTWRLGEYFYGSDEFDNSAAPVDAALVTTAALASPTNGPDEVASVTSRVHIAKTPQLFEYDLDGNQTLVTTKTGTWRVTYNGENRPVLWERVAVDSNTLTSNTQTRVSMSFDHQGRRRMFLETAADGSTNHIDHFSYDNYLCVARNRWQPGGTIATDRFVWDPTEPVATRPLVFYQPNAPPQLYSIDGNKNVSDLVDADDGTISAHYEYAPFGEVILSSGDLALTNPFRFSSEYADDLIALVYYNYRHLDLVVGRWLCTDPITDFVGYNQYWFSLVCFVPDFLGLAGNITHGQRKCNVDDDCCTLVLKTNAWIENYKERMKELIADKYDLQHKDPARYNNHIDEIERSQNNVLKCINLIYGKCGLTDSIPQFSPMETPRKIPVPSPIPQPFLDFDFIPSLLPSLPRKPVFPPLPSSILPIPLFLIPI